MQFVQGHSIRNIHMHKTDMAPHLQGLQSFVHRAHKWMDWIHILDSQAQGTPVSLCSYLRPN